MAVVTMKQLLEAGAHFGHQAKIGHKRRLADGHAAHHDARARARRLVYARQRHRTHWHARASPPRATLEIVYILAPRETADLAW